MPDHDPLYAALLATPQEPEAQAFAARYAPLVWFDATEPFLPLAAAYTIFRADAPSPSMERAVVLVTPEHPLATSAIEYAIWWDWDISHLYELEHVWVYLDDQGRVVGSEASGTAWRTSIRIPSWPSIKPPITRADWWPSYRCDS